MILKYMELLISFQHIKITFKHIEKDICCTDIPYLIIYHNIFNISAFWYSNKILYNNRIIYPFFYFFYNVFNNTLIWFILLQINYDFKEKFTLEEPFDINQKFTNFFDYVYGKRKTLLINQTNFYLIYWKMR